MRKVNIHAIPQDAILAKTIFTETGNILLGAGVKLTERYIDRLSMLGIDVIYIEDPATDDLEPSDILSDHTRKTALSTVHDTLTKMIDHPQLKRKKTITDLGSTYRQVFSLIVDDLLSSKDLVVNLANMHSLESYMFHHSVNVAVLAGIMGISLGYNRNQLIELGTGALLFDIGMTKVPKEIWTKQGPLTAKEREILQTHPYEGFKILKSQHDLSLVSAHIALQHHERFNGEGYPRKLKGHEIHEYARIVAIADVYDALTSKRQYRERHSPSEAIEFLFASGNTSFDANLINHFVKHIAIYPVATTVLLSTNQIGVVTKLHPDSMNRPTVRVIKESNGEAVNPPYEIDLKNHLDIVIVNEI